MKDDNVNDDDEDDNGIIGVTAAAHNFPFGVACENVCGTPALGERKERKTLSTRSYHFNT